MRLKYLFGILFIGLNFSVWAQGITDSIHQIEEVVTYGDYRKYQPGSNFDNIVIEHGSGNQTATIDQLIAKNSPIYLKGNAGGLSTIRVRGTAPDHTSFNFGGINLNSLTLGHSNVSDIPSFLFDRLEIQYGSSSTLNGSGSIGGAVYLGQQNSWIKGYKGQLKTIQGSFGEHMYGTKLYLGNGRLESITKLYSYKKRNDFPFENYSHKDYIITRQPIIENQNNAKINNKGFLQELNYRFTANEFFTSSIWIEDNWHQIQPTVKSNQDTVKAEELLNKHIRIWSAYKNENKKLKYSIGAGYVHDYQMYNTNVAQEIITDRLVSDLSAKYAFTKYMEAKIGAKYKYIVPTVYSYSAESITKEQHLDIYLSYFYQPIKKLKTTVNLRQMFVTNYKVPFTPSFGAEYSVWAKDDNLLKVNTSIAKSYRVPTFNDRFWGNQGNPNLRPEDGFNVDAGFTYYYCNGLNHTTLKLNGFYMDIDDWIEWRLFSKWEASNVQRVISKGIELHWDGHLQMGRTTSELTVNYTLNSAKKIESKETKELTNQQLIYSPFHIGNINYNFGYKDWNAFVVGSFTGSRYTEYAASSRYQLPAYFLTDLGLSYKFNFHEHTLNTTFAANNIFNVSYQNERYYAMPGRNFRISIAININNIKPL